jgi:threonine/homoserine/homoserine lactone efflux protein
LIEAASLQLTNPKPIFFFISIFPQFIDPHANYIPQFVVLVLTYTVLVFIIHSIYGVLAHKTQRYLSSKKGNTLVRRIGGTTLIGFGLLLADSKKP